MKLFKRTALFYILPASVVMSILLVTYFSFKFTIIENDFKKDAHSKAYALGVAARNTLLSETYMVFDNVLTSYLSLNNVVAVRIYNENNELVASRKLENIYPDRLSQNIAYSYYGLDVLTGSYIVVRHATKGVDFMESDEDHKNDTMIGRTEVDLANYVNYANFLSEILVSIFFFIICLALAIWNAHRSCLQMTDFSSGFKNLIDGTHTEYSPDYKPILYKQIDDVINLYLKLNAKSKKNRNEENATYEKEIILLKEQVEKLIKSNQQIKSSYRSSREFLAGVSHDFRSPISGIVMQANLLLKSSLQESQLDRCKHIQNATDQLLDLVDDILDFSHLESSDMSAETEPVDLINILEKNIIDARFSTRDKLINIFFLPDTNMPNYVLLDDGLVSRILSNLLANAIKYTDAGDIVLSVQAKSIGSDNKFTLRVEINDEGRGIPKEKIQRVFDSYYQESAGNSSITGVGLGLSICKGLVEGMGGKIGVESVADFGSTFWFELPSTIYSYKSAAQENLSNTLRAANIDLAIVHSHPIFLQSVVSQFELIGIKPTAYSNHEALNGLHNVILGYQLSNQKNTLKKLRGHAKHIISVEVEPEGIIDESSKEGIDQILDYNTPIYRAAQRIFQLVQRSNMPSIGVKNPVDPNAISNPLMSFINTTENKMLEGFFILVIDDNKHSCIGICDSLKYLGAQTETADCAFKGKEKINRIKYDLIITDFNLDDGNGIDVTDIAKHSLQNTGTSVICITGDVTIQANPACQEAFESILIKPLNEDNLVKAILDATHKKQTN